MSLQNQQKISRILQTEGDILSLESEASQFELRPNVNQNTLNTETDNIMTVKEIEIHQPQNLLNKSTSKESDQQTDQQIREQVSFESINGDQEQQKSWKKFNFHFNTTWLGRVFMFDLLKLLFTTRKTLQRQNEIQEKDIPFLFPEDQIQNVSAQFEGYMNDERQKMQQRGQEIGAMSMLKTFLKTFKQQLLIEYLLIVMVNAFKIITSVCIRNLISDIGYQESKSRLYMWAGIIAGCNILSVLCNHHSNKINYSLFSSFRVMFMRSLQEEANIGKLVNLVSGDLTTVEIKSYTIVSLFVIPFSLIAIGVVLYFRFEGYGVLGLVLMICFIPLQLLIAKQSSKAFAQKSGLVDKRVNLTSEIIEGIRLIKMYAWEGAFMKTILEIRRLELQKVFTIFLYYVIEHAVSISTGVLATYFVFTLTYSYGDSSFLTIANMYATLDLLLFTRSQVNTCAGYGLSGALELKVVFQRMASVFKIKQVQMTSIDGKNEYEELEIKTGEIKMKNFYAFWKSEQPVLSDITLNIKPGQLITIVGKIGSGKSTFLNCILKEIPKYKGGFAFKGKLAYVEQEPYIFSSSVRDNILFGKKYKESFYNEVVKVCNLLDDFILFSNGDQTQIGEKGTNISGGQRARISLARALYSQADIYLLDDPLSAVDSKVSRSLFNEAIKQFLQHQTVILVTHQIQFTKDTDQIIIMDQGRISALGTYEELSDTLRELANQVNLNESQKVDKSKSITKQDQQDHQNKNENEKMNSEISSKQSDKEDNTNSDKIKEVNEEGEENKQAIKKKVDELYTKESDENISVTTQTYWKYLKASKYISILPILMVLFLTSEVLTLLFTSAIGYYGESGYGEKDVINALGYITLGYLINVLIKYFMLIKLENSCSQNLHQKMIESLVRSKTEYFDRTQSGRIINRFSTDLNQSLPLTSIDSLEILCNYFVLLIMLIIINPYFLIVAFVLIILLYCYMMISKACLIQSKQLDLRNRSPVFNYFTATVQGVLPIKVYEQTSQFQYKFDQLSDNSLRSSFYYWYITRAFGAYVHFLACLTGIIGIFMLIAIGKSGTQVGQSIVYFLSMSDIIQWGLRQLIQTDVIMSSAQRVLNMCELKSEAALLTDYDYQKLQMKLTTSGDNGNNILEKKFPSEGKVEFINVKMRYREGLDPVLNSLNFTINPGMKVGCVGRTGAGKSSILQALFRMTEIDSPQDENDQIAIKIDNHNTKNLGLHTLRGGISMIPQVPFIFSGTIQRNLDPLNEYTEYQINEIVEEIGLKDKISELPKGIQTDMTNASEIFSVGQKQLICLGRAILKQSKLLILDEATANVDMITDELIQRKVKERFSNSTVITVAHRLNTIADYDMVIVMDKGKVVESGEPYLLLQQSESVFKTMVNHTGKLNSATILDIAKTAYELRTNKVSS